MRKTMLMLTAALVLAAPAAARPGYWGTPGWGQSLGLGINIGGGHARDSREGRVSVARFIAADVDPAALRHGAIAVVAADNALLGAGPQDPFQAAVYARLVQAGYVGGVAPAAAGQVAEVRIVRSLVRPEGPRPRPVSGEAAVGGGTYGGYGALGINVDLSGPDKALVATRLETAIRDRASGKLLWEGHAEIVTREGDGKWTSERVADRLAGELFKDFPARAQRS
ncbi:hypothetical protein HMF7854_03835 [Sphingomonas ginkgonis]|uniref:DUF4136 domain-containing protein n=1 Tax=Sphingomonas ginkgonis TaxID=2315330 RepID=A0A3R9WP49_9SPHN|nr:DUF4136 domain-containing protein [Sphingomonas ginkgonis]RST30052.1 hypothetical protein HMF7854_03835 [Sphingomonas ginkgonis]